MIWLIEPTAWKAYLAARKTVQVTSEQIASFIAKVEAETVTAEQVSAALPDSAPRNLKLAGSVAQIDISGVLTKKPDFLAYFFGGGNTTYSAIQGALAYADASPDVKQIVLSVDSPGGQVDGLFETIAALQAVASRKPVTVQSSLAASAAYAIVSVAGKIEASSPSSTFGSIGVVSTYVIDEDTVDITSTQAPNKRPDPTTEKGQAVIRAYLDELHDLFVDAIADGRGVTAKVVNAEFGGGAVFTAAEAKRRGMVDSIKRSPLRAVGSTTKATVETGGAENQKETNMDLKTLKAQHPDLVEALLKEGATAERDRVEAHLTMGEASGDMKTAVEAIKSGSPMTAKLQAQYMAAGLNRRDQNAHAQDAQAAAAVVAGAEGAAPARDLGDILADQLGAPTLEKK
jgi:ClpP class serine protease